MSNNNVPKKRPNSASTPNSGLAGGEHGGKIEMSEHQGTAFAFMTTPTDNLEPLRSAPKIQGGGQLYEYGGSGSGGIAAHERPRGKPSLLGSLESGDQYDEDMASSRGERATLGQMAEQIQADARAFALANGDDSDDGAGGGDESYERIGAGAGLTDDDEGVCQPGHEQTGRWTRKEHELFLEALKKHGKVGHVT